MQKGVQSKTCAISLSCRHQQRVDSLFAQRTLLRLTSLGLSAFYQTVDNKATQCICAELLSSQSLAEERLTEVDLSHCYQVGDAGVQWLVGSRYSPALRQLDLSGTDLTGNCFVRRLPRLCKLRLEGCASLSAAGLANIAASCPCLSSLCLAKCKQLTDGDLRDPLSILATSLHDLDLSYTGISGSFLPLRRPCASLRSLNLNCCPRLKDERLSSDRLLASFPCLQVLDVSATPLTASFLLLSSAAIPPCPSLWRLSMDFCPGLRADQLDPALLSRRFPLLRSLCAFGNGPGGFLPQWAEELRRCPRPTGISVVVSESSESSVESDCDYARHRGLHLADWAMTKTRMVRGKPFMLSPFWLQSVEG